MLTFIRNATKGWTAKILLILLVASFAIWGVSGSMIQGVGNSVVTVGETNVGLVEYRLAYDRALQQLQRQFGTRLTREQANAFGLNSNVVNQLVSGALLDESARKMGLNLSKDKLAGIIGEDEAFRDAAGQFSRTQLQQVLRSVGMREDQYVETRKNVAVRNQIIEGAAGQFSLPDAYLEILSKYQAEERKFDFVVVSESDLPEIAQPGGEEIKLYYEANLKNYNAPEYRKLNIVKLEAADIADEAAVTKEAIEADYEARKDGFSTQEKRKIEQLVFADAAKAEAAIASLKAGKTFDQILQDEGKSPADVALGVLSRKEIPDAKIGDAAFALQVNQTSELIDGLFGKVILRVTEIIPGVTKPLSEVESEIRKALALTNAANEIFEIHDKLEDERAAGEDLAKSAEIAGLKLRVIDAVDRSARDPGGNVIADIPQSTELLAAAFDTDEGVEADPIAIGSDGFVWFEVADVIAERQKTLEEVKAAVTADWILEEKKKALNALAESIRGRIATGEEFNSVIAALLPTQEGQPPRIVQQTALVKRDGESIGLTNNAVEAGFTIAKSDATVVPSEDGSSVVVLKVAEVAEGVKIALTDDEKNQLNQLAGDDMVNQMIAKIQESEKVEISQQAIDAALSYN